MNESAVLLWGGSGSGKSGFLGALWHAGGSEEGSGRWRISPTDVDDSQSMEYLREAHAVLRSGERRATMPSDDYPFYRLTARRWVGGNPRAALKLAFKDPAGEYADNPERAREQGTELIDDLLRAAGVIWLFDCVPSERPQLSDIVRHIGTLRQRTGGGTVGTPVAFCLSKIDLLEETAAQHARKNPRAALANILSEDILKQLEGTFGQYDFFAISSKGTTPGRIEPIELNGVLDWIHTNARRRQVRTRARQLRRPFSRVALTVALAALAWLAIDQSRNGPAAAERRAELQHAEGRIELAASLYAEGRVDSAFTVVAGVELPRNHPRLIELDTLVTFIAYQAGAARVLAGGTADSLFDAGIAAAKRASATLREAQALARVRFAHAEMCTLYRCAGREVRESLEYVVANAADARLVERARELLEETR